MFNFYIPGSMHVEFLITAQAAKEAEEFFVEGDAIRDISGCPHKEVRRKSLVGSVVEHEYFHHRHACSTTYGLFQFEIDSHALHHRESIVKALPKPTKLVSPFPIAEFRETLDAPLSSALALCGLTDIMLTALDKLQIDVLRLGIEDNQFRYPVSIPQTGPSKEERVAVENSLTTNDLVEAIAAWKQYSWLLIHWYYGGFPDPTTLEREWLSWLRETNPSYLAAANYVAERSGAYLKHGLFGIILDLALMPPLFSSGDFGWTQISPPLRLEAILDACNDLPKSIIKRDVLELLTLSEYSHIVEMIETKLGWQPMTKSIDDALACLHRDSQTLEAWNNQGELMAQAKNAGLVFSTGLAAYTMQFYHGLVNRKLYPGYVLFPHYHPNRELLGHLMCPITTNYADGMSLNVLRVGPDEFGMHPFLALLVLWDICWGLWLYETVNESTEAIGMKPHSRRFYAQIPRALQDTYRSSAIASKILDVLLQDWMPFEQFLSLRLGKDHDTYFVSHADDSP